MNRTQHHLDLANAHQRKAAEARAESRKHTRAGDLNEARAATLLARANINLREHHLALAEIADQNT